MRMILSKCRITTTTHDTIGGAMIHQEPLLKVGQQLLDRTSCSVDSAQRSTQQASPVHQRLPSTCVQQGLACLCATECKSPTDSRAYVCRSIQQAAPACSCKSAMLHASWDVIMALPSIHGIRKRCTKQGRVPHMWGHWWGLLGCCFLSNWKY
jgi:hypothetical protein